MGKEWTVACDWLRHGQNVVVCAVIDGTGSAPRGMGAYMVVSEKDGIVGTIGGGAVEHEARAEAARVLQRGAGCIRHYCLHQNEAADLGMICGGNVEVLFHLLTPADLSVVQQVQASCEIHTSAWLWFQLKGESAAEFGCMTAEDEQKLFPAGLFGRDAVFAPPYFVLPVSKGERVLVFGGGHVSQALVPLLASLDFTCVVLDDRAAFTDPSLFPAAAETRLCDYEDLSTLSVAPGDYVVILTRGHQGDYSVLRQVLGSSADYIGCIGSKTKVRLTKERLTADGFDEGSLARIHSPIGLSIGAVTPAEIAVSIAAEIIACRHQFSV